MCQSATPCSSNVCQFSDSYGDLSQIAGYWVVDTVSFTGTTVTTTAQFGLANVAVGQGGVGFFQDLPVHGIFGMAQAALASALTSSGTTTFLALLNNAGYAAFSMCLDDANPLLILDTPFTSDPRFQYTALVSSTSPSFYSVILNDVQLNGVSIGIAPAIYNNGSTILDSGTTNLVLPQTAFNALKAQTLALCASNNITGICNVASNATFFDGFCYQLSQSELSILPNVSFIIDTLNPLVLTGPDYMQLNGNIYCTGFSSQADGGGTILGDAFMRAYHIVFNVQAQTVGFGPLDTCNGTAAPSNPTSTAPTRNPSTPTSPNSNPVPIFSPFGNAGRNQFNPLLLVFIAIVALLNSNMLQ